MALYGKTFLDTKKLLYSLKVNDYEGKNIRVQGITPFGAKLKENVLIADIENTGEVELQFNVFPEYTKMEEYYLYFKVQISAVKNYTYIRFNVYSDRDEEDVYEFDEKVVSMKSHFFRLPSKFFKHPSRVYVKIKRLDSSIYMRFDQFEPRILYKIENVFKTVGKEAVFQSLVGLQSVMPAYLLSAFVSPPTEIIGSLMFWIWANSKDLLKAGRKHVTSKILSHEEETRHHRHDPVNFPLYLERLSLTINKFVDALIPDFKSFSFVPFIEKGTTINDSDFFAQVFKTLVTISIVVIIISFLFRLYEFPV